MNAPLIMPQHSTASFGKFVAEVGKHYDKLATLRASQEARVRLINSASIFWTCLLYVISGHDGVNL
jgi:hypothetical protein